MQFLQISRRIARFLKPIIIRQTDMRFISSASQFSGSFQWLNHASTSSSVLQGLVYIQLRKEFKLGEMELVKNASSEGANPEKNSNLDHFYARNGITLGLRTLTSTKRMDRCTHLHSHSSSVSLLIPRSSYSSEAAKLAGDPIVTVKELHDKILDSVNIKRSMPPNASLWSLIENCQNQDDINLLFEALQNLRRFRLSNLCIHDNFNSNLCQQVAKTCVRVGALDSGKKALWKHNVHGLTPSVASAHHLLSYALEHKNSEVMEEVMTLLKTNDLPLQPGIADLVFRICHDTDKWDLVAKYSKKFSKAGVKLRKTSMYGWNLLPREGFILESKPEEAAAIIQVICQAYRDDKNSVVSTEFKKLVNEWPVDVIRHQIEEDKKALAASLKSVIPSMLNTLLSSGLSVSVDLDELHKNEALLS